MDSFLAFLSIPYVSISLKIVIILIITKVLISFNKKFFKSATDRIKTSNHSKDITYLSFLKHVVTAIIYFIAFIAICDNIPGFDNTISALLASTGILTVVIGFASQEAMSNIVSGIMVLTFKPFIVGDVITYNGTAGNVEEITLRHTVIKTLENKRLIVPNGSINKDVIENANFNENKVCAFLNIGISYESSIDDARAIILNHCVSHKDFFDNRTDVEKQNNAPKVTIRVVNLGDSSVDLRAWIWAENTAKSFAMKCDLLESIKKDFDKQGINIPYPHVTIKKD